MSLLLLVLLLLLLQLLLVKDDEIIVVAESCGFGVVFADDNGLDNINVGGRPWAKFDCNGVVSSCKATELARR